MAQRGIGGEVVKFETEAEVEGEQRMATPLGPTWIKASSPGEVHRGGGLVVVVEVWGGRWTLGSIFLPGPPVR